MPVTLVNFYAENGASSFLEWVDRQEKKVQDKIFDAVARLEELGFELRRPEAEYLGNNIYELRVKRGHVNYRLLYFFDDVKDKKTGRTARRRAVIAHGCTKEGKISAKDMELTMRRHERFLAAPAAHTYVPPSDQMARPGNKQGE